MTLKFQICAAGIMYQVVGSGLGRMGLRGKLFGAYRYLFIWVMMSGMALDTWVLWSKAWRDKYGHLQH